MNHRERRGCAEKESKPVQITSVFQPSVVPRSHPPTWSQGINLRELNEERNSSMSLKTLAPAIVTAMTFLSIFTVGARTNSQTFDAAKAYKKCVACHGAKAEKKFDATKSDDEHVQIILKGKKAEKPPNMPGYESKGINAEQAKALLDYMKSLRQ
jgi:mono/diheme cytochrome c family protein